LLGEIFRYRHKLHHENDYPVDALHPFTS
jgi:hypothetical protein